MDGRERPLGRAMAEYGMPQSGARFIGAARGGENAPGRAAPAVLRQAIYGRASRFACATAVARTMLPIFAPGTT